LWTAPQAVHFGGSTTLDRRTAVGTAPANSTMRPRLLPFLCFLPLSGLGAWSPPEAADCLVPIEWRIAELDERFGLDRQEAEDAVRLAGMLWEDAVGRILFSRDPTDGFPIRFVYDERQERTRERARRSAEVEASARRIDEARSGLEDRRHELERARARYERRLQAYQDQSPRSEPERRALEEMADEINRMVDRVNAETERLNRRIEEHNRANAELQADFPPTVVQTGVYRESRRTLGMRVLSVDREIQIFQFEDRGHLLLVIAHELGHALGLGHTGVPGSVMVDASGPRSPDEARPRLHPADVELLRARCPDL
jgi:hypothetical protein